tara:strand:+ start:9590 stop:10033 length:444 start_codon:yes stop_codon:yes gene_type:complete
MNLVITVDGPVDSNTYLKTDFRVVRNNGIFRMVKYGDDSDLQKFSSSEFFNRVREACEEHMNGEKCSWEIGYVSLDQLGYVTAYIMCWEIDFEVYESVCETLGTDLRWDDITDLEIFRKINFKYCERDEVVQKVEETKTLINYWFIP